MAAALLSSMPPRPTFERARPRSASSTGSPDYGRGETYPQEAAAVDGARCHGGQLLVNHASSSVDASSQFAVIASNSTQPAARLWTGKVLVVSGSGVASRCPLGVDPGWWQEFGVSVVADADLPATVVDDSMVVPAEQDQIVHVSGSAIGPVDDVVGVAPVGGSGAAREGAAAIASGQRGPLAGADGAVFAADVERDGGGAGDDAGDAGVAGDAADGLCGDRPAAAEFAGWDATLGGGAAQAVEADDHIEVGSDPVPGRQAAGVAGSAGELDQCVGHPLCRGTRIGCAVAVGVGCGYRVQR